MIDERTLLEFFHALGYVFPHDEFSEREASDRRLVKDLPTILLLDRLTENLQDQEDVHARFIGRQRIKSRQGQVELGAQKFNQRCVQGRLFVETKHLDALGH